MCDQIAAYCHCGLSDFHTGPHVCECGGSWYGTYHTDTFQVVSLPSKYAGPFRKTVKEK